MNFEWPEKVSLTVRVDGDELDVEQEYVRADLVDRYRRALKMMAEMIDEALYPTEADYE